MTINYRFFESSDGKTTFAAGIAYTGYFDNDELPSYISKRITKERRLKNRLENLRPEDAPGLPCDGYTYKWSEIYRANSPNSIDEENGWDPYDAMEERDRMLRLSKTP